MSMLGGSGTPAKVPALQADAVLSQANPVSGTKYTVLATTKNARVKGIVAAVTWTVQPSPLEVHLTVDGIAITHAQANPVSTSSYFPIVTVQAAITAQLMLTQSENATYQSPLYENRSVKIEAETTGGTTSSLDARVKYSKW